MIGQTFVWDASSAEDDMGEGKSETEGWLLRESTTFIFVVVVT
jgi:hypothetical protein